MRVAIASDIHGNRHAFEAVIAAAEGAGAEELWCLGDLVGYGAEPDECVALASEHSAVCLAGNHDLAVTGRLPIDDFSRGAALAAELCLDVTRQRISMIGHSHVALAFHRSEGEPATGSTRRPGEVADLRRGKWLVNPGSVGQPRDGDPRAAWLLLDTRAATAEWRREEYDIAGAQAAIRAARLPDSLAERLRHGQ